MSPLQERVTKERRVPVQWHLDSAPDEMLQVLLDSDGELGRGSFSVVFKIDALQVLKITTCTASNLILPKLCDKAAPGFPLVFKDFGRIGYVDGVEGFYEDIPLHAYLMERLYRSRELLDVWASPCPRGDALRARSVSDADGGLTWLYGVIVEKPPFRAEDDEPLPGSTVHPLVQKLETALRNTRFQSLVSAAKRLAPRVVAKEWFFDWASRGNFERNVLLSRWGEPILADPVYARDQVPWIKPYPWLCPGSGSY